MPLALRMGKTSLWNFWSVIRGLLLQVVAQLVDADHLVAASVALGPVGRPAQPREQGVGEHTVLFIAFESHILRETRGFE